MEKLKHGDDSWGSPDKRPSFSQILWFQDLSELQIPLKFFDDHLASEETELVTLKGPCGSCEAKLQRREDSAYLVQGWQHFVAIHSLGEIEYALFLYNGGMSFDVKIFGTSGWLKSYEASSSAESSSPLSSPFFTHKMKWSNFGQKCNLLIPKAFASKHLPMSRQAMELRDGNGISWLTYIIVTGNGQLAINKGWKAFADAHSIKKGDVYVFELVEPNLMKVRIV